MFLKFSQELQRRVGVVGKKDLETGLGLHGVGSFSGHWGVFRCEEAVWEKGFGFFFLKHL